ncbi:MAG: GNAT family N-acetyltransferase [Actinomycetota bacterium]|nr:GNAT family N-acetyltransferase [Actinomycetota bacterium]
MSDLRWLSGDDPSGWDELAALFTDRNREAIPEDRPYTGEEMRAGARHAPSYRCAFQVLALRDGEAVAAAAGGMDRIREETAWMLFLYVAPPHRRRGIGSTLLEAVRDMAREGGRRMLHTMTVGIATGVRFAERAGGRRGLVVEQNRCRTAGLDRAHLRSWCERAAERASGYSLVAFDGTCPDEHLDNFVAAMPIMNTAPRTESTEDYVPSAEQVRENTAALARQGTRSWTVCVRDDRTGRFVGYTELFFSVFRPWQAMQGDTGVHPEHRNRGLGRWLKAHNALRLLDQQPEVEFIETWNADSNAAMLSINRAMGFQVVARRQEWEIPV